MSIYSNIWGLKSRIVGTVLAISAAVSVLIAFPGIAHAANWGTMKNGYGLCLDDTNYSKTAGNQMQVYTCNGLATQNWHIYDYGYTRSGAFEAMFQVQQSSMCLDEYQQSGSKVVQWPCNTRDPAQWWVVTQDGNGRNQLCSVYCADGGSIRGDKVYAINVEPIPNTAPGDSWTLPPLA